MIVGRFAPSPSGPLHFGSLIAAVGSFLNAKSQHGKWLVRIEDLDRPRNQAGADSTILNTLESFGLYWDGTVQYQSQRLPLYDQILSELAQRHLSFPCTCTRQQTRGKRYSGTCRNGLSGERSAHSVRLKTSNQLIELQDLAQGTIKQNIGEEIGDFVIKRADGVIAYHLAVVVDDADQMITEIVRGSDLLDSTPRQIFLQEILEYSRPQYLHLPVAIDHSGYKLSKQNKAKALQTEHASELIHAVLEFLHQAPPAELKSATVDECIQWGLTHWNVNNIPKTLSVSV